MVVHDTEGGGGVTNKHIKICYTQFISVDTSEIIGLRCNKKADGA